MSRSLGLPKIYPYFFLHGIYFTPLCDLLFYYFAIGLPFLPQLLHPLFCSLWVSHPSVLFSGSCCRRSSHCSLSAVLLTLISHSSVPCHELHTAGFICILTSVLALHTHVLHVINHMCIGVLFLFLFSVLRIDPGPVQAGLTLRLRAPGQVSPMYLGTQFP